MNKIEKEIEVPAHDLSNVFGQFDEHTIII